MGTGRLDAAGAERVVRALATLAALAALAGAEEEPDAYSAAEWAQPMSPALARPHPRPRPLRLPARARARARALLGAEEAGAVGRRRPRPSRLLSMAETGPPENTTVSRIAAARTPTPPMIIFLGMGTSWLAFVAGDQSSPASPLADQSRQQSLRHQVLVQGPGPVVPLQSAEPQRTSGCVASSSSPSPNQESSTPGLRLEPGGASVAPFPSGRIGNLEGRR